MTLHSPLALVKSDQAYLAFRPSLAAPPAGPVEVEPIVFDGSLWTISGIAPNGNYAGQFRVDGSLTRPLAIVNAPDLSYPCAYVEDGVVFVYGVSLDHKRISMMWSTDLAAWSAPVVVFTATAGMEFFNTSVAKCTMSGKYRMVVETKDVAYPNNVFVVHVLSGVNVTSWTMTPAVFSNASYVNCPTIRYVGATLYMLFMEWTGTQYCTFVAQSLDDGQTWTRGYGADGETIPFVPAAGEGNNNSDVALCEFHGKTYFTYGRGDQVSWLECATAVYPGTMKQYFEQFFPASPPPPPTAQNLIPPMTGQTSSGVTVTASDTFQSSTFYAWKSADRDGSTFWHCNTTLAYPHYVRVDFAAARTISSYAIKPRAGFPNQAPKNFTLKGLRVSDGVWVTVDTGANQTYTDGVFNTFTLASPASYASFELVIDSNVEGSVNLSIGELELRG